MKKLDKLILGSFIGPFILTFIVVDFILLTVNMLKYFDEIFGKGLSFGVYMELISYFVISISPMALPLAVLLSSLMTFGNLGEHFELTAIKSSGISLLRALLPIGIFVVALTFFAYMSNNYIVPKINLKTFSLLYDIRMKSPALDIKEGVFYNGIPNYSIKVNKKIDDVRLKDIIIYDHGAGQGNLHIIMADSGRMEPFFNDRYMQLVLYNGYNYQESAGQRGIQEKPVSFSRTKFAMNQIVFNLDAFDMNRTPEDLWSGNRSIKNIGELKSDMDSMDREITQWLFYNYANTEGNYSYFARNRKILPPDDIMVKKKYIDSLKNIKFQEEYNSTRAPDTFEENNRAKIDQRKSLPSGSRADSAKVNDRMDSLKDGTDTLAIAMVDTSAGVTQDEEPSPEQEMAERDSMIMEAFEEEMDTAVTNTADMPPPAGTDYVAPKVAEEIIEITPGQKAMLDSITGMNRYRAAAASVALNSARTLKNNFNTNKLRIDNLEREYRRFQISWYQKYTQAIACLVMFMIGAPLGAIIKKGGLGMPVLISIIFFIMFYMLTITGEKWAKEGMVNTLFGTCFSNLALLPFGLFFLRQARKDARLFEADFYHSLFARIKKFLQRFKKKDQELQAKEAA